MTPLENVLRRHFHPLCAIGSEVGSAVGGQRTRSIGDTFARIYAHRDALEITRLAEITQLDEIGLPTYVVCIPHRSTESWSSGKGFTREAALVAALMEAYECRCLMSRSRHLLPALTVREASRHGRILHPSESGDPRAEDRYPRSARFDWMRCVELHAAEERIAPSDLVGQQAPSAPGITVINRHRSTNGLAAGNCALEAIQHGLLELIERDATMHSYFRPSKKVTVRAAVLPARLRRLIEKIEDARIAWHVFDLTTDIGIPVYEVRLVQEAGFDAYHIHTGWGCHLDPVVALAKGLTEACQVRLGYFAGARKDVASGTQSSEHHRMLIEELARAETVLLRRRPKPATLVGALRQILTMLKKVGLSQAFVTDLSLPNIELPVVATYIPGLEGLTFDGDKYYPGLRVQRAIATRSGAALTLTESSRA